MNAVNACAVNAVVHQRRGRLAGRAAREVARVVLEAATEASRLQLCEVGRDAVAQPLRLSHPALGTQRRRPLPELLRDAR